MSSSRHDTPIINARHGNRIVLLILSLSRPNTILSGAADMFDQNRISLAVAIACFCPSLECS